VGDALVGMRGEGVEYLFGQRRWQFAKKGDEARRRGRVLQQVAGDESGVAVGVVAWHDALVHQDHAHLGPVQILFAQGFKQGDRRLAARDCEAGLTAFGDGCAQCCGDVRRDGLGCGVGVFG